MSSMRPPQSRRSLCKRGRSPPPSNLWWMRGRRRDHRGSRDSASGRGRLRSARPKSFRGLGHHNHGGHSSCTSSIRQRPGSSEASRRHVHSTGKNDRTDCKKFFGYRLDDPEHHLDVLWAMRHWCTQASECSRQWQHVGLPVMVGCCPPPEAISAQMTKDERPAHRDVLTDEQLDRPANEERPRRGQGKGKAKAQAAGGAGKSKAKAKASSSSRARGAEEEGEGSGSSSSGGSSTSSTSPSSSGSTSSSSASS